MEQTILQNISRWRTLCVYLLECPMTECHMTECPMTEYPMTDCRMTECPVTEFPMTECPGNKRLANTFYRIYTINDFHLLQFISSHNFQ